MKEFDFTKVDISEFDIEGAERIGIPKGDDRQPCIEAFQKVTGIEVPDFKEGDRRLKRISEGREFFLLKGCDIPGFAGGEAIDLGVCGTDSVDTYRAQPDVPPIRWQAIGPAMCRLVLMCQEGKMDALNPRLEAQRWGAAMPVASPLPNSVNAVAASRDLPFYAADLPKGMTISGSMEIMPELLEDRGIDLIADRVASGETARANGLVELMPLMGIYPALVQRAA